MTRFWMAVGAVLICFSLQVQVSALEMRMTDISADDVPGTWSAGPDQLHTLFFVDDATEVTLSPGAEIKVEAYGFDPETGEGQLRLVLVTGTVLVTGGDLNDTRPIIIRAGHATLSLAAGAAIIRTGPQGTRAFLKNGERLQVTAGGEQQTLLRPEFAVVVPTGKRPGAPYPMPPDQLEADLAALGLTPLPPGARTPGLPGGARPGNVRLADASLDGLSDRRRPGGDNAQNLPPPNIDFSTFSEGAQTAQGTAPRGIAVSEVPNFRAGGRAASRETDENGEGGQGSLLLGRQDLNSVPEYDPSFVIDFPIFNDIRPFGPSSAKLFPDVGFTAINENNDLDAVTLSLGDRAYVWLDDWYGGKAGVFGFDAAGNHESGFELNEFNEGAVFTFFLDGSLFCCAPEGLYGTAGPFPTSVGDLNDDANTATILNAGAILGFREFSNFLFMQIQNTATGAQQIIANGDLDGAPDAFTPLTVDQFFISPGLTQAQRDLADKSLTSDPLMPEAGSDLAAGQRAFLRRESWTSLGPAGELSTTDLVDTGFFVLNPAAPSGGVDDMLKWTSQVMHADFGLKWNNDGQQRSTISLTLGTTDYFTAEPGLQYMNFNEVFAEYVIRPADTDALTDANTIGSSNDGMAASISLKTPLASSAAGGGNLAIDPDRMGFIVLENFGDFPIDPGSRPRPDLPGGTERVVGTDDSTDFALLRLGQAWNSRQLARAEAPGTMHGFATGFVEQPDGADILLFPFAEFSTTPNIVSNNVGRDDITVSFTLEDASERQFMLGGPDASAFIDTDFFGAMTAEGDAALALVAGAPLATAGPDDGVFRLGDLELPFTGDAPTYRHLQWGFFFGDLAAAGADTEHVHLGTFATGTPIDIADLNGLEGTATYRGHAIGNVFNAGDLYLASGAFHETFNFSDGAGRTMLDFDGRNFAGESVMRDGGYASLLTSADGFGARLNGAFVGPGGPLPGGVVGQFQIQNTETDPARTYRANGTFAGEATQP